MRRHQLNRWLQFIILLGLVVVPLASTSQPTQAQDDEALHAYTWREMGLLMRYPASWVSTNYAGLPMLITDANAVAAAEQGESPAVPALGFLYYPQARDLNTSELLNTVFPDVETNASEVSGVNAISATYDDEETAQTIHILAFESPVTRDPGIILAVAPVGEWDNFAAEFNTVMASVEFLDTAAEMSFFDGEVQVNVSDNWQTASNGQVLGIAPNLDTAEAVVTGDISDLEGFLRAQIVVPSGLGVDADSPTAAQEVLERFVGQPLTTVHNFEWAEGVPAVATEFKFGNLTLLMVAVVDGDTALLIGGGAQANNWVRYQDWVFGMLNMTVFNEYPAPTNLDAILRGDAVEGDGIFGMNLE